MKAEDLMMDVEQLIALLQDMPPKAKVFVGTESDGFDVTSGIYEVKKDAVGRVIIADAYYG